MRFVSMFFHLLLGVLFYFVFEWLFLTNVDILFIHVGSPRLLLDPNFLLWLLQSFVVLYWVRHTLQENFPDQKVLNIGAFACYILWLYVRWLSIASMVSVFSWWFGLSIIIILVVVLMWQIYINFFKSNSVSFVDGEVNDLRSPPFFIELLLLLKSLLEYYSIAEEDAMEYRPEFMHFMVNYLALRKLPLFFSSLNMFSIIFWGQIPWFFIAGLGVSFVLFSYWEQARAQVIALNLYHYKRLYCRVLHDTYTDAGYVYFDGLPSGGGKKFIRIVKRWISPRGKGLAFVTIAACLIGVIGAGPYLDSYIADAPFRAAERERISYIRELQSRIKNDELQGKAPAPEVKEALEILERGKEPTSRFTVPGKVSDFIENTKGSFDESSDKDKRK